MFLFYSLFLSLWIPFEQTSLTKINNSLVDLSTMNSQSSNNLKRIVIKNAHFYYEGTNTRVRFFGTNVCYDNSFPDKSLSMGIAQRLSQIGINVVRFHHMDNYNIWNQDQTALSKVALDKLHYFIYCLNQNGIYANINLHVSRVYKHEAFSKELQGIFLFGKSLDRFFEPFIQDQIQYARDLLGSYNNYTKYKISEDPGIAFIELNNENSIFDVIKNIERIRGTVFYDSLLFQWQNYLKEKFKTIEKVNERINVDIINESDDMASSGQINFRSGSSENYEEKNSQFNIYHIISPVSTKYSIQLIINKMAKIKKDSIYSIKFNASSKIASSISICFQYATSPWTVISKFVILELTEKLNEYLVELPTLNDFDDSISYQLTINFDNEMVNEYTFSKIQIFKGTKFYDCSKNGTFEGIEIPLAGIDTEPFMAEYRIFLSYIELKTQNRLLNVLKNELKTKTIITDSQAQYGNYLNYHREYMNSDYLDLHYYWQHPYFAAGHNWERDYFRIENTAMVDNNKTENPLFSILAYQGTNRPFTISELNNPFPNEHQHETLIMIASWAAYHDFDAIYQFSYEQPKKITDSNEISHYFSMATNPILMTTAPIAATMFRSYGVKTSNSSLVLQIPKKSLFDANEKETVYPSNFIQKYQRNLCWKPTKIEFTDIDSDEIKLNSDECQNSTLFPYLTEEIKWSFDSNNKGLYIVDSEKVKTATGHLNNVTFGSFNFTIVIDDVNRYSASVGVTSLDSKPLIKSEKIIFNFLSRTMNTNQKWNDDRTTTAKNWGEAPVLVECLNVTGSFYGGKNAKLTVLNKDGEENGTLQLNYDDVNDIWSFKSNPSNPSIWYLLTREITSSDQNEKSKTLIIVLAVIVPVAVVIIIVIIVIVVVLKKKQNEDSNDFVLL